jgi:hypothetical protein
MVETKKFLPRFKYDKSKTEEYQLALTTSLRNLWVANSIGHLGADEIVDLLWVLQQSLLLVASLWEGVVERDIATNLNLMPIVVR